MDDASLDHNVISATAMISAFGKGGLSNAASNLFKELENLRVGPNLRTYNKLIRATVTTTAHHCPSSLSPLPLTLLSCHCPSPSSVTTAHHPLAPSDHWPYPSCPSSRKCLEVFGRYHLTWIIELINNMEVKGVKPNLATFHKLIRSCSEAKQVTLP